MRLYLRLILVLGGLFCLLIAGALFLGYRSRSRIATHYHENLGKLYPLRISDVDYQIHLSLAGSRCFDAVPTWFYQAAREAGIDPQDLGSFFTRFDDIALDATTRLTCATSTHAPMYHYP